MLRECSRRSSSIQATQDGRAEGLQGFIAGLSTVSGAMSWSNILSMVETLEENNVEPTGWAATPAIKRLMRSTVRVSSTDSRMIMDEPDSLAGYPLLVSSNVPTTAGSPANSNALILGNFGDLMLGFWDSFSVLVNPYETSAYRRAGVKVRGLVSVDIAARHVESFVAMTSVDAG